MNYSTPSGSTTTVEARQLDLVRFEHDWLGSLGSYTLGSRRNIMPDPDLTKDKDPTLPEAAQNSASDENELTDEQLEKAAGGIALNGLDSGLVLTD